METQVVELKGVRVRVAEYAVPSANTPGQYYQVYVTLEGDWQCDCHWGHRHYGDNNIKRCWHARFALLLELAESLLGPVNWRTMDEARAGNHKAQVFLLTQAITQLVRQGELRMAAQAAEDLNKYLAALSVQGAYNPEAASAASAA
jgi:hypothetical protein